MSVNSTFLDKHIDLPSLPLIIQKIQRSINEQNISYPELAQIIETDQAFTARILRMVNSPFYGFAGKIISVEEAITMLGLNTIHQLLLATSLINTTKVNDKSIDLNSFWIHCFSVGVIAKNLLYKTSKEMQNEGFIGGVLHDIGRLIYVKIDPEKFVAFYTGDVTVIDLETEKDAFGIDHQELGRMLAQKWNFPDNISNAISCHHFPQKLETHQRLVSAVHIADILSHALNIGNSFSYYITDFFPTAWQNLKVDMKELETILKRAMIEIDKSKQIMGLLN